MSKYIPDGERVNKNFKTNSSLGDLAAHHEITLWGLLLAIAEVSANNFVLVDKLHAKGILSDEDLEDISKALQNTDYLRNIYSHSAQIFHEKCERIAFAAQYPEKINEYVEKKAAGENPDDPMKGREK